MYSTAYSLLTVYVQHDSVQSVYSTYTIIIVCTHILREEEDNSHSLRSFTKSKCINTIVRSYREQDTTHTDWHTYRQYSSLVSRLFHLTSLIFRYSMLVFGLVSRLSLLATRITLFSALLYSHAFTLSLSFSLWWCVSFYTQTGKNSKIIFCTVKFYTAENMYNYFAL